MPCPKCGADGYVPTEVVVICRHCLNSGRQFSTQGPLGDLGRMLELSRALRERSLEARPPEPERTGRRLPALGR